MTTVLKILTLLFNWLAFIGIWFLSVEALQIATIFKLIVLNSPAYYIIAISLLSLSWKISDKLTIEIK